MQKEISFATPADSEKMNQIYYDTWMSTYPNENFGVTKTDIEDMLKNVLLPETIAGHQKWLDNLPENKKVFVAKENGEVMGFCYVQKGDEGNPNKLLAIYVSEESQGKGVGTELWNTALSELNPLVDTEVQVVAYNDNAIQFYKRIGFIDEGKRILDDGDYRLKSGTVLPIACLRRPADVATGN